MTALAGVLVVLAVAVAGIALFPGRSARLLPSVRGRPGGRDPPCRRNGTPLGRRRNQRAIDRAFPDMLDLFVVTVTAGYPPLEALRALRPVAHPLIGDVLQRVLDRVDRGERTVDALASITDGLGSRGSTFVDTLTMTERAGLPLAPAVERLADEARQHRRRVAEADARQLPVRLAFPLVLCTLSSFVLVAIVPLLLGALPSFDRRAP